MRLSDGLHPDFRTKNDFRGRKIKGSIEKWFGQLVEMMVDLELISFEKQVVGFKKGKAV